MRLLVDECYPERLVLALRARGHDAVWAVDVCRSAPDDIVLATATREGRIVITEDKGFGDLTMRDGQQAVGIVIAQVDRFPGGIAEAVATVCELIEDLAASLVGSITVIEPGRTRQRALPPASADGSASMRD